MSNILSDLHEKCAAAMLNCTSNAIKHLSGQDREKQIEQLSKVAANYCEIDYEFQVHDATFKGIKKDDGVNCDQPCEDVNTTQFENLLKSNVNKLKKPQTHPIMEEFKRRTRNHISLDSSDIVETESTQSLIDPFTKLPIKVPLKNTICGHYYEESVMKETISKNPKTKCPIVGCGNRNVITLKNLLLDKYVLSSQATVSQTNTSVQEIE